MMIAHVSQGNAGALPPALITAQEAKQQLALQNPALNIRCEQGAR
ncbi:hypothetical protein BH11PSE12_BH11PSE12_27030 [soil metagenome]